MGEGSLSSNIIVHVYGCGMGITNPPEDLKPPLASAAFSIGKINCILHYVPHTRQSSATAHITRQLNNSLASLALHSRK